jgi:RNA polymerase sigma-70 factor (ECF subfamily)
LTYNADDPGDRGGVVSAGPGHRLSRADFAALLREHHRTLWFIAASVLGDKAHAHDAVQEAAMIAMSKLDDFDPSTSFAAWMGQVVRYTALNEGRKLVRTRARGVADDERSGPDRAAAPTPGPEDAAFDAKVSEALQTLDDRVRACLLLRTVQGLSYAAISTALGLPEGTVMSHVHRAKAALRLRLETAYAGKGGAR